MENVPESKLGWVMVGLRPIKPGTPVTEEMVQKMLMEAFLPDKVYKLFLIGEIIEDRSGTLKEMEDGYYILRAGMPDYQNGDYCIISSHEEGNLLFMPIESNNELLQNAQNISGNSDSVWSASTPSA